MRTNALEVQEILTTSIGEGPITTFIGVANRMVTAILGEDTTLSTAQLRDIECWLTAHLIASVKERMPENEKVSEASIKYLGQFTQGLDSTPYGQMVRAIDITGKMDQIGKKIIDVYAVKSFDD